MQAAQFLKSRSMRAHTHSGSLHACKGDLTAGTRTCVWHTHIRQPALCCCNWFCVFNKMRLGLLVMPLRWHLQFERQGKTPMGGATPGD